MIGPRASVLRRQRSQHELPGPSRHRHDADLFFFTLYNQPKYLDLYNSQHGGIASSRRCRTTRSSSAMTACTTGTSCSRLRTTACTPSPASPASIPTTGKPTGHELHRSATRRNPGLRRDRSLPRRHAHAACWQVRVEVVVPPGYELVKEEDKNILIGDNYIAPVTQQFGGLGNIFILPDQAEIAARLQRQQPAESDHRLWDASTSPAMKVTRAASRPSGPASAQRASCPTSSACSRGSGEVAPFAGATRNLCDRKEVTLTDQTSALAKFYIFTSTHVAAHFTGVITDDFTAEFDPFSPQFGEKFSPAVPAGVASRIGPATKSRASIPTSGVPTTA